MDRFVNRSATNPACSPTKRMPLVSAKQGCVTAKQCAIPFLKSFYERGGQLFCRCCNVDVDHIRKYTITECLGRAEEDVLPSNQGSMAWVVDT